MRTYSVLLFELLIQLIMKRSLLSALLLVILVAQSHAQSITVTAPKAGDQLPGGVPYSIKASFTGELTSPVTYEYQIDNDGFWRYIGEATFSGGTPTTYSFTWQNTPEQGIEQAQIRLRDAAGVIGASGVFTFLAVPRLEGLLVNGGQNPIPVNSDVLITWTVSGEPGLLDLSYNVDGKKTVIKNNMPDTTTSFTWRSPSTPMNEVYFLLEAEKAYDLEVGPFMIQEVAGLSNIVVNGGVTPIPAGQEVLITWNVTGEPGLIDLSYKIGGYIYPIANDLASTTTSYTWKTPNTSIPELYLVLEPADAQMVEVGPFELREILSVGTPDRTRSVEDLEIAIHPNPASGTLTIVAPDRQGEMTIMLADMAGRELIRQTAQGERVQLDISSIPAGSYVITIQDGAEITSRSLSIQR